MNITFIALLLTLILVPVFSDFYGDDYGDAYRNLYKYWRKRYGRKSTNAIACANAVAGFNGGISRLVTDIKEQANEWIIYADLDALDEVSYYISHSCHGQPLELVDQQISNNQEEENQERTKGCDALFGIVGSILAQDETLAFRGGYERGTKLSRKVLRAGRDLGDECVIRLQEITEEEAERDAAANEEGGVDEDEWDLGEERQIFMNAGLSWGFSTFGGYNNEEEDLEEQLEEKREEREEREEEREEELQEIREQREEQREEKEEEREEKEEEREEQLEERQEEKEEEREEREEEREERLEEIREEKEEEREEAAERQRRREREDRQKQENNNKPALRIGFNGGGNNEEASTGRWDAQGWSSMGWDNGNNGENNEDGELALEVGAGRDKFLSFGAKLYANQWDSGDYVDYIGYDDYSGDYDEGRKIQSL